MKKHEIKAFIMIPAAFFFLLLLWSGGSRLMGVQPSRTALPDLAKADVDLFFTQAGSGDTVAFGEAGKTAAESRHFVPCPVYADAGFKVPDPGTMRDSNGNVIRESCYRNTVYEAFPPENGFV